jgi:hypothetical protein
MESCRKNSAVEIEATPPPPIKKARPCKKAEATRDADPAELGSMVQAEEGVTPPAAPPKRSRKKKVTDEASSRVETDVKTSSESSDSSALQVPTGADAVSAPAKPKRTRRVGEPKPKRYPVGEHSCLHDKRVTRVRPTQSLTHLAQALSRFTHDVVLAGPGLVYRRRRNAALSADVP